MLTLLASSMVAASPQVYLDGVRVEATQVSSASIVLQVDERLRLWLPIAREWRLTTEVSSTDGALLVFDQHRTLVGASVQAASGAPSRYLGGRDLKALRGFAALGWGAGLERLTSALPPAVCLTVEGGGAALKLGALPAGLPCLTVSLEPEATVDLSRFKRLEWLDLRANGTLAVVPAPVKHLAARQLRVEASALARLDSLVSLAVHDTDSLVLQGSFKALERLRVEDVAEVTIATLSAPRLRSLDVRRSKLKVLDVDAPLLEEAVLLDDHVTSEASADFAKAHAAVALITNWTSFLRHSLRDADHLRVRANGTCGQTAGETLLELPTPADVRGLLDSTELEEPAPLGVHCMCCGDPTLEFFRDSVRTETISLHHGLRIRWRQHAGDIELGTNGLVRFLASHGVTKPFEEATAAAPALKAAREVLRVRRALVPAPLLPLFDRGDVPELLRALKKHSPDRPTYVGILLRLRAASTVPRDPSALLVEGPLDREIETLTADELIAAARLPRSAELERALCWLLLTPRPPDIARDPRVQELMAQLARSALSSPSARTRVDAVSSLFDNQGEGALVVLRQLVVGPIPVGAGGAGGEPSGFDFAILLQSMLPSHERVEERDLRVLAAWALVLRKAPGLREPLERLLDDMTGADADLLRAALRKLNAR